MLCPIYFYLLQPLEVFPEECHGPLGPRGAQLHDGVLEQGLDVVLLHVELAFPEAALLLAGGAARRHGSLWGKHTDACENCLQRANVNLAFDLTNSLGN